MSIIDMLVRVDAICKKFDKYDPSKQHKDLNINPDDHFLQLYTTMEAEIEATVKKANEAAEEKNRAAVATMNAEIRRTKAALREEIPKLERLAKKKVKALSPEDLAARPDLVVALAARIDDIPEGTMMGAKKKKKIDKSHIEIKIDSAAAAFRSERYEHTAESAAYQEEFQHRKNKQDQNLDIISEGLSTLKNMAEDISEELDKQDPMVGEMEEKIDKATGDLTKNNARMKEVVSKIRSGRNFCIDVILLCVVLGIAAYIYKVLKK
ncbi:syntaxin-71 [Selaginella moellendorffii]|uniref:syntaxin-71 n=1 Tax=Selaginella moellendorffii TaxID=88036 RepID=UPI000D1C681C|nr:syntaxin-71 [Selaginella moellendorffii]|eukprot:XP_024543286.1 syntaxin-71 [Selaginella moellendorffii]